jgi:hypothetical protein
MKLVGNLKIKKDTQVVSEAFSKREFVLTVVDGAFSNDILIQLVKDKVTLINDINIGDLLEVEVNLKGKEWTSPSGEVKYFNSIECWKVSKI